MFFIFSASSDVAQSTNFLADTETGENIVGFSKWILSSDQPTRNLPSTRSSRWSLHHARDHPKRYFSPDSSMFGSDRVFSLEQVKQQHNTAESCFVVIDSIVYDLTKFKSSHPGGEFVIQKLAGQDVTEQFYGLHKHEILVRYSDRLRVGSIENQSPKIIQPKGVISKFPYAESSAWVGLKSPYFKESHYRFRSALREFYDNEVVPEAILFESLGKYPSKDIWKKSGAIGLLACRIGPGPHLQYAPSLPAGIKPEEFDYFHEMIAHEENARLPGAVSYADGLGAGLVIGLPPIINFGSKEMIAAIVPPVLSGEKQICLAISEPTAGSDVANVECTAVKSPCGKFFIVSGVKKWITNATFCEYFTTAVRTGGPGMGGISMLLIQRSAGVETRQIPTSYASSAGTGYITFDNVKVPIENLIGKENGGFQVIMRWLIICAVLRGSRLVIEESFKWANQRKVFGKLLISQPVIRLKLASMIAQLEAVQNWLENLTYQMTRMSYAEAASKLAGPLALCKLNATRMAKNVSDEACQIFGGRAITKGGMGSVVEASQRTCKFAAILGGSEEIMGDLGIRQAIKDIPADSKL